MADNEAASRSRLKQGQVMRCSREDMMDYGVGIDGIGGGLF